MWILDVPVQCFALLYKALVHSYRRWMATVIRTAVPVLCVVIAWYLIFHYAQPTLTHPDSNVIATIPKCVVGKKQDSCTTLLYNVPLDDNTNGSFVDDIMQTLCNINSPKLVFGKDVKRTPFRGSSLTDWIYLNSNTTQGAIEFTTALLHDPDSPDGASLVEYNVVYNSTYLEQQTMTLLINKIYETDVRKNMFRTVDEAIVNTLKTYEAPSAKPSITVLSKPFPDTGYASQFNYIILNQVQLIFYYVAFTIGSIFTLTTLAKEKMTGMRGYLKLLGLHDSAFWISTYIEQMGYLTLSVGIALLLGNILPDLDFFDRCSIWVSLTVFLTYTATMLALSTFLSTLVAKTVFANILGSVVFLIGLGFALFWSILDTLTYSMWRSRLAAWFSPFPPFLFMKMLMDIKTLTVGPASTQIFPGDEYNGDNHFSWDDMFDPLPIYQSDSYKRGATPIVPTTWDSVQYMLIECAILMLLTVFLDVIMPNKDKVGQPIWFFLSPYYWGFGRGGGSDVGERSGLMDGEEEVALRVRHMSKDYSKGLFKTGAISALRPFSVTVPSSTVFCMLGHNGAGKTTAINCFIGLQRPTHGDALIFGRNVVTEVSRVHEIMSVTPQFDHLFDDITAWEHMWMINSLKPGKDRNTKEELREKLFSVRLHKNADQRSKEFSGGMKRRLSFILSTIGNPRVLFLDEPTTGMDPGNRNFVWDCIKELKKSRLVILTTHSMEEADMLGDRIAIMAQGKLRAEGGSLALKKQFGSGYRVNINAEVDNLEAVKQEVKRMLPGAQLVQENAGSLVYGLPDVDPDGTTARFFEYLQEQSGKLINDWGIHNTTLEDVFVSITRKILGQDVSFVNANKASKRDQDERAYFRETTTRMQKYINALEAHVHLLSGMLQERGVAAPQMALPELDAPDDSGVVVPQYEDEDVAQSSGGYVPTPGDIVRS
eukprot:TRINITY_DN3690_c0_g1_i1.p1 TRINITY_DN3690_c0_g1~~TRINITY_DN3690_c0_g1_i1.p1  ORF type:complete len:938 (+),score=222.20 TRINITY_DN3690_c0_g1_i1:144-2957(+)